MRRDAGCGYQAGGPQEPGRNGPRHPVELYQSGARRLPRAGAWLVALMVGLVLAGCAAPVIPAPPGVEASAAASLGAAPATPVTPRPAAEPTVRPTPVPVPDCFALMETVPALEEARVARVIDGDTIVLEDGRRVRYIGIDTPELGSGGVRDQPWAREAAAANAALVAGRTVLMEKDVSETDRFGRLLRYVYVDGDQVNARLVREGYASAPSYPPDVRYQACLRQLEREARNARIGRWG